MSSDLITRKPTPAMIELLRRGAADRRGVMTPFDPNCRTLDGIFRRDMAETVSEPGTTSSWVLINKRGRDYLAKLDEAQASKHSEAHDAQFLDADGKFRTDRSEQAYMSAVDNADQTAREEGFERGTEPWFKVVTSSYASLIDDGMYTEPTLAAEEAQEAPRSAPQVQPVETEFPSMGAAVEFLGSLKTGERVRITREGRTRDYSVSMPARRSGSQGTVRVTVTLGPGRYAFEVSAGDLFAQRGDKATMTFGGTKMMRTPAAPTTTQEDTTMTEQSAPQDFRGLTRDDVARDAAAGLETLAAEDRAMVEGKAPSVVLGLVFFRAQRAWVDSRREHTAEEGAAYDRCANIASAAMIFEKADDPAAAAAAMAEYQRIIDTERAAEAKEREEARAATLAAEWAGAKRAGKYLVRTEDRGHGTVAVYVKGPAAEVNSIDRASVAYARAHGLRPGAAAGGGEFFRGEYIAQRAYDRA